MVAAVRLPPFLQRLRPLKAPSASTLFFVAVAVLASAPAWIVKYPPMVDVPFHIATIRVLHSIGDPAYGMGDDLMLTLGRTQYVAYYVTGSLLAYVFGVVKANIVLMSVYLGGTVLALRSLLQAMGKDERLSLFVVPLLVNVMFMYGLLPFVLGIPVMFWALATAIRWFEQRTLGRGLLLAFLAITLFYSHIFPFAIFGLGVVATFPWTRPREWPRAAIPFVPAVGVLAWWTLFTAAGKLTSGALTDSTKDAKQPLDQAIGDVPNWFTNVFQDLTDEKLTIALALLVVLTLGLALGDRERRVKPVARWYVLLPLACVVLYFSLPGGHGYIWLIYQRFPILFAMCAIPLIPMPTGFRGMLVTAGALLLATASVVNTCQHFIKFQLEEVGDIDAAIGSMAPKKKVCALIFDKSSRIVNFPSFLHFGSYYQVHGGGVVMFTYTGYAHWPVDFKPGHFPPPGNGPARMRWEWTPEQVPIQEIFPYYDYVLVRGSGFQAPPGTYHVKFRGDRWTVWARD